MFKTNIEPATHNKDSTGINTISLTPRNALGKFCIHLVNKITNVAAINDATIPPKNPD